MTAKKRASGSKDTKRERGAYPLYICTVLAPKSLTPCAIYVNDKGNLNYYRAYSPDRSVAYGSAYFGIDEELGDFRCRRQHMEGLDTMEDLGLGLGTALYIAGVCVLKAASENPQTMSVDGRSVDEACTYSGETVGGGRTRSASRAWSSLGKHGLADLTHESAFARDHFFLDEAQIAERARQLSGYTWVESIHPTQVEVIGEKDIPIDVMDFEKNVQGSGLILNLEWPMFHGVEFTPPPPEVWPLMDLRYTTAAELNVWLYQIDEMLGTPGTYEAEVKRAFRKKRPSWDRIRKAWAKRRNPAGLSAEASKWLQDYTTGEWV